MSRPLFLEVFESVTDPDAAPDAAAVADALVKAHARGREEGWTAAQDAGEEAMRDAAWALTAALREASGAVDEIRDALAAEAAQTMAAAIRGVCPALARQGFPAAAAALIETRLKAAPRPLTVFAAPEMVPVLARALEGAPPPMPTLEADPDLSDLALRVAWRDGHAMLDLDEALSAILDLAGAMAGPGEAPAGETMEPGGHAAPDAFADPAPGPAPEPPDAPLPDILSDRALSEDPDHEQ